MARKLISREVTIQGHPGNWDVESYPDETAHKDENAPWGIRRGTSSRRVRRRRWQFRRRGGAGRSSRRPRHGPDLDPPATFADNEPVDPYRDIDHYEVYVREDANFANSDLPVMVIPALTSVDSTRALSTGIKKGRKPNSEFILENLNPYLSKESRQYVSLKAVGSTGRSPPSCPCRLGQT